MTKKFWHEDAEIIRHKYNEVNEDIVIAVLEEDSHDIELMIEKNDETGKADLTLFCCIKHGPNEKDWESDDYALDGADVTKEISACKTWAEIEEFMSKQLAAHYNK